MPVSVHFGGLTVQQLSYRIDFPAARDLGKGGEN